MWNKLLIGTSTLLMLSLPCSAAGTKQVPAGGTWTVTAAESQTTLDHLVLGDGAVVRFADGVRYWDLKALHAEIGHDVTIDARGQEGKTGAAGSSPSPTVASGCDKALAGDNGAAGNPGGQGINVDLQLGVVSMGSLTVLTDGGKGGTGGTGGKGQDASADKSCSSTRGGNGGNGGKGGDGGDAGNISLVHWNASGGEIGNLNHRITVSAVGGAAGSAGQGGPGGEGSPGRYINQRSLAGNQTWQAGGKSGAVGTAGDVGQAGKQGRTMVTERTGQAVPAAYTSSKPPVSSQQDKAQSQEIDLLKQQLEMMQQRLDKLEKP